MMCRRSTKSPPGLIRFLFLFCVVYLATPGMVNLSYAQGMGVATGNGVAAPPRPLPPGMKAPTVQYEDLAAKAGLTGVNISGAEKGKQFIVETTGNGVAIFDYDNDGLPDIFLVNGDRFDKNLPAPTHFLYHNLGGLKFEDVTAKAGLAHTGWGQGVCAGDFDNDGNTDLLVTQWGQNVLYRNQGDGTFREQTKAAGLSTPETRWNTGCAFLDFNRDGFLDLVVVHYIALDITKTPRPGDRSSCRWKGIAVLCGPRGLPGETVSLYQNDGHGHFTDVSDALHITTAKNYYGFTPLVSDFDNDGWPDIYVACDSTASLYYHNLAGKGFAESAVMSGVAYNEDGREQAGMGVTAADYDHDGWFDIFKTNFADDTDILYRNHGGGDFTDETVSSGLAVNTKYLGWGTAFLDFDNDGWPDLIVANGHVYPEVDDAGAGEKFKQPRYLYWNRGDGQFFDLSRQSGSGISDPHSSRGLAIGDLDNDGQLEIVISNMGEAPSLLKNLAPQTGHALSVRAITTTGRDAIGARVTLTAGGRKQMDEVRSGGSFISQSDFRLHFGLGAATTADLAVRWLDGKTESIPAAKAGEMVTIQEGKGIVRRQPFTVAKQAP
jgi:enediyne biosynthesis protein E4